LKDTEVYESNTLEYQCLNPEGYRSIRK